MVYRNLKLRRIPFEKRRLLRISTPDITYSLMLFADYGTHGVAVVHDSERPALQVLGAVRAPASVTDSLDPSAVDGAI